VTHSFKKSKNRFFASPFEKKKVTTNRFCNSKVMRKFGLSKSIKLIIVACFEEIVTHKGAKSNSKSRCFFCVTFFKKNLKNRWRFGLFAFLCVQKKHPIFLRHLFDTKPLRITKKTCKKLWTHFLKKIYVNCFRPLTGDGNRFFCKFRVKNAIFRFCVTWFKKQVTKVESPQPYMRFVTWQNVIFKFQSTVRHILWLS